MSSYRGERIGPSFEVLISVFLVVVGAAFLVTLYLAQLKKADEGILMAQLRSFRMQQRLFKVVHGHGPADLKELVNDNFSLFPLGASEVEQQPSTGLLEPEAVLAAAVDNGGHPVDPWGNRYEIELGTGRIHSVTEGYEDW